MAQEVDLSAMRRLLADITAKADQAQTKVLSTIETKHAEFVAAADQAVELRGAVDGLRSDLHHAVAALQGDGEGSTQQLHAAIAEHATVTAELEALSAASTVLRTLLEVQRQCAELDRLTAEARYTEAAELTLELSRALQTISAPEASMEPGIVRDSKAQYYQRRSVLTQRLEDVLEQHVTFNTGRLTALRAPVKQAWDALHLLSLRERRAERLAEELRRAVLLPLLETSRKLRSPQALCARTSAEEGTVSWTWVAVEDSAQPLGLLPALESLFSFMHEHVAGGCNLVYAALGKRLWPPVASNLVQRLAGTGCGQEVEEFEARMCASGLISSKERTLSRHVHERSRALVEQRRTAVLAEVRGWLLHSEPALVAVSDADEPGSISSKLAGDPQGEPSVLNEKLRHALMDDAGFLRLPKMRVSAPVQALAQRVRGLVEEMAAALGQGQVETAGDMSKLIRELCTLFAVVRPYVQKGQLKTNARCCAVFFADCLYLVHVLLLLPYSSALPAKHQHLVLFVDLVPQLRRLGETHLLAMLRYQQQQLIAALKPCNLAQGLTNDRAYVAAEAALGAAVQQVKAAAQGLSAALPALLLREVAGLLLGALCQNLLGRLWQLHGASPDDLGCLCSLITSALVGSRQVFSIVENACSSSGLKVEQDLAAEVPGWAALTLVADLLGSGFSRFLEHRTEILKVFKKEEVLKLMHLSWQDTFLSPEEAWDTLESAD